MQKQAADDRWMTESGRSRLKDCTQCLSEMSHLVAMEAE
jgi:hypothetical protein